MAISETRVICECGSANVQKLSREAISHKHFTDYRVTYKCSDCGKIMVKGA
jgi:uncharacterized protein with PIN domain